MESGGNFVRGNLIFHKILEYLFLVVVHLGNIVFLFFNSRMLTHVTPPVLFESVRTAFVKMTKFVACGFSTSPRATLKDFALKHFLDIRCPVTRLELANRLSPSERHPSLVRIFVGEQNAEVKGLIVRKIGYEKIFQILTMITDFPPVIIDRWKDYQLIEVFIPLDLEALSMMEDNVRADEIYEDDDEIYEYDGYVYFEDLKKLEIYNSYLRARYLKMKNPSTGKYHIEGVPPNIRTCKEALSWRIGGLEWNPAEIS
ncbi:MAG: hypothetical protein RMJ39_10200 [Deltaproteobacteria bacterium]|nr:hypothetical protein [Deltaproteobacteria bacterium]